MFAATKTDASDVPVGTKVAVYEAPLPLKFETLALVMLKSLKTKSDVVSLTVKVKLIDVSSDVAPELTVDELIEIVGTVVSYVQLN